MMRYLKRLGRLCWIPIFVALVMVGEIAMRQPRLVDALPAPERFLWHATNVQAKLDQLEGWEDQRGVDVLFLGNSTVLAGIDPVVFDEARGVTGKDEVSYNAALEGLPAAAVGQFATVYLDRVQPKLMVYGLTPQDLNRNSPTGRDLTQRVAEAPAMFAATARGPARSLANVLLERSSLFRYRFIIIDYLLRGGDLEPIPPIYFDERGATSDSTVLADIDPDARSHLLNNDGVWAYDVRGTQTNALEALSGVLRKRGVDLLLVNMPMADGYYENFTSESHYTGYTMALSDLAERNQVTLFDMEALPSKTAFEDRHFADLNHLNDAGAEKLSRILGDWTSSDLDKRED